MMNQQTIQEQFQHIVKMLLQRRLKEALAQLEVFLQECNRWDLQSQLEQTKTSYQYMLQYYLQGVEDPGRKSLYLQLMRAAWEIASEGKVALLDKVSYSYYHSIRNNKRAMIANRGMTEWLQQLESITDDIALCQLMPDGAKRMEDIQLRKEECNDYLFCYVWGNSKWNTEDISAAQDYLTSSLIAESDLSLLVSAITLSLLECFDLNKLTWLFNAYEHHFIQVSQRALVGIAILLHKYQDILFLYPEIENRLKCLEENWGFAQSLNRIYQQLLQSKETERIDKKMREEIIPEMMKKATFVRNIKFDLEENGMDENDHNPDWEKAMEDSGLGEKIREMGEMQMAGADIYLSTFSQLKSYVFFRKPSNWLYPFDKHHSSVIKTFGTDTDKESTLLNIMLESAFFCNSDKYSLSFIMAHIPQSQRDMMLSQMTDQQDINNLNEEKLDTLRKHALKPEVASNQYIHDLYRFFKLSTWKQELHDIFKEDIALHHIPQLQALLTKPEFLKAIGEFYFKNGHPLEALYIFQELATQECFDADIFQKIGYCLQKSKQYKEAIKAYQKADILKPDHLWTLRHIATCHRMLHQFEQALEYYRKVESIEPENKKIQFLIGSCLAELEQYEEAIQQFFKLDYLEGENAKTWRALAWCLFIKGKYEQATKYYDKILNKQPLAVDYLNAGHVAWVMGALQQAVSLYKKSIAESGNKEVFIEAFEKDKAILLSKGIIAEEIPLILDMCE